MPQSSSPNDDQPKHPGRTEDGKFAEGNKFGIAHQKSSQLKARAMRAAFDAAITEDDMRAIVRVLLEKALKGDLDAIKMILDRQLGPVSKDSGQSTEPAARLVLVMPDDGRTIDNRAGS